MTLKDLSVGHRAVVTAVGGEGATRQHFLDMGIIPGTEVSVVKYAPMGDPVEICVHGYELTLRLDDAAKIEVDESAVSDQQKDVKAAKSINEHYGLGEGGRFHPKGSGDPVPKGETLTFALVGNQNSGKTTLFNQLTKRRRDNRTSQHVHNRPSGHLFHVALLKRRARIAEFCP